MKSKTFRPAYLGQRSEAQRKAELDRRRGKTAARGYDATWRRIRLAHLRAEPLCRFCKAKGLLRAAEVVDHIDGDAWNRSDANLRSLCKPCHDSRTARDQGFARGRQPRG